MLYNLHIKIYFKAIGTQMVHENIKHCNPNQLKRIKPVNNTCSLKVQSKLPVMSKFLYVVNNIWKWLPYAKDSTFQKMFK